METGSAVRAHPGFPAAGVLPTRGSCAKPVSIEENTNQTRPASPTYDCVGLYGASCVRTPRWRHNLRVGWETPWDVLVSANWRYFGAVQLDSNSAQPTLTQTPFDTSFDARLPSVSYLDLSAIWTVRHGLEVRAGVNNVLDKDPPLVSSLITGTGAPMRMESWKLATSAQGIAGPAPRGLEYVLLLPGLLVAVRAAVAIGCRGPGAGWRIAGQILIGVIFSALTHPAPLATAAWLACAWAQAMSYVLVVGLVALIGTGSEARPDDGGAHVGAVAPHPVRRRRPVCVTTT